jgi:hypothetical protein
VIQVTASSYHQVPSGLDHKRCLPRIRISMSAPELIDRRRIIHDYRMTEVHRIYGSADRGSSIGIFDDWAQFNTMAVGAGQIFVIVRHVAVNGIGVVVHVPDFASLPLSIEGDDPEASESDKCGSRTFIYRHNIFLFFFNVEKQLPE